MKKKKKSNMINLSNRTKKCTEGNVSPMLVPPLVFVQIAQEHEIAGSILSPQVPLDPSLFILNILGVDGLIFWVHKVMLIDDIVVIDAAMDVLQIVVTCPSIRYYSCAWLDPLSNNAFQCFTCPVRHLHEETLPYSTLNTTWAKRA